MVQRLTGIATLVCFALALIAADAAHEQVTAEPPTISVPGTITGEAPGQVPLPIRVGPEAAVPRHSFVTVRGLPSMAGLSEGYAIAPGSWAVPLHALAGLNIKLPAGLTGRTDLMISLLAKDGAVLFEARSALVLGPAALVGARAPEATAKAGTAAAPPAPASEGARPGGSGARPLPVLQPQDRDKALKFLKKGDEELAAGLVAPARLLYERAAELGLAQAAMALAATYDAAELTRPHLRGVAPDAKEAKRWYERAQQLGAGDADQRLQRLGAK
jgi:hypothetical protein